MNKVALVLFAIFGVCSAHAGTTTIQCVVQSSTIEKVKPGSLISLVEKVEADEFSGVKFTSITLTAKDLGIVNQQVYTENDIGIMEDFYNRTLRNSDGTPLFQFSARNRGNTVGQFEILTTKQSAILACSARSE